MAVISVNKDVDVNVISQIILPSSAEEIEGGDARVTLSGQLPGGSRSLKTRSSSQTRHLLTLARTLSLLAMQRWSRTTPIQR